MHLKLIRPALLACFAFSLVHSALAEPTPPVTPPPLPTATPDIEPNDDLIPPPPATPPPQETPSPSPPVTPPPVNPENSIPVVVTYGEGQETRASITQGLMEPVGVPPEQSVTVTLLLPSTYGGQAVALGLYDGGQVGQFAPPTTQITDLGPLFQVTSEGTIQFNFKAGAVLGLYRILVTAGPNQYLLQFYAVTRRSTSDLPSPDLSPPPTPNPPPTPPPE